MPKTKKAAAELVARFEKIYPAAACALEYEGEAWRLLVMGRLSAQCTDARVNIVCRELFSKYPTPSALAEAPIADIEGIIRPCGLFHTKAANLKDACRMLCEDYGGIIPESMEELLKLPGVGRKIANLLLGDIYHKPAVVADTHCIRICGRLGFYPETLKDPYKVELALSKVIEPEKQSNFCHRLVMFGREYCKAQSPSCGACPIKDLCRHNK